MIFVAAAIILGIADLLIKYYVNQHAESLEGKVLPGGRARIHIIYNEGFAANRMSDKKGLVRAVTAVSALLYAACFLFIVRSRENGFIKTCLAIAFGGVIGNTAERLLKGKVTDYLQFIRKKKNGKLGKYVFNFADLCIFAGFISGVISLISNIVPTQKTAEKILFNIKKC